MALSLVMAACAPAATQATTNAPSSTSATTTQKSSTTSTTTVQESPVKEPSAPKSNTPVYGGTITYSITSDPTAWDPTKAQVIRVSHEQLTSNELLQGDWTKGPQGSGKTNWDWGYLADVTLETGELAQSWELKDDGTIIFHLREGVRYQNRAPANGRELTAQDVVWNMNMQFNYPTAWQSMSYPPEKMAVVADTLLPGGDPRRPTSIRALDKYTVEIKCPPASQALMFLEIGDNAYTNPPEIWAGTGAGQGLGMASWDKVVGSGPFLITGYVPGSLVEYTKNPNYFETDPLYPGKNYQWPYIQSIRQLIIPDMSTRQAAFRVGKLDMMLGLTFEDEQLLLKQRPELQTKRRISNPYIACGREDKANLPYQDIRVRQALNMAVDKDAWLKGYLKGDGEMLGYPYAPGPDWAKYYTPMNQLPPEVQQLYTYNPDKAKQLLKEAGYPNGFQAKIQVPTAKVDEVAILKSDLAKVGVILNILPLEPGAFSAIDAANNHDEMWYGTGKAIWAPEQQMATKKGMYSNDAIIVDPYYDAAGIIIARDVVKDPESFFKVVKESAVHELASAWGIFMPVPYNYNMWWPWVSNYMGISWTGWAGTSDWYKSIWIDTEMKKTMGY
jgi:peptide/nickel transport system substrate-binding protein